jgi:hypothetical protein
MAGVLERNTSVPKIFQRLCQGIKRVVFEVKLFAIRGNYKAENRKIRFNNSYGNSGNKKIRRQKVKSKWLKTEVRFRPSPLVPRPLKVEKKLEDKK